MQPSQSRIVFVTIATTLALVFQTWLEGVDVNVEHDKAFDFKSARTWAWNPEEAGHVRMARTQEDNPDGMKHWAEPVILDQVATEMMRRGLQRAPSHPDVTLTYYLMLGINMTAQTMGQFLPATTAWGYAPFAPATQSIKMMNEGALVLDVAAKGTVVWRGVAKARVAFDADEKKREAVLREGVRDLLKRYPPK